MRRVLLLVLATLLSGCVSYSVMPPVRPDRVQWTEAECRLLDGFLLGRVCWVW